MKNGYYKFAYKLFILLAIMFLVDRVGGSILAYYFDKEPQGNDAAFSHAIENPREEILIYGSSRAMHTYDPRVFRRELGLSCFNCGRNASTIIYHAAILPSALEREGPPPRAIILDITPKELSWRGGEDGNDILASMILPYVNKNKRFEKLANDLFPRELAKAKVSKLYTYNSMILSIIRNYSAKEKFDIEGYVPLFGIKASRQPVTLNVNAEIDDYAKDKFEFFIREVTSHHIPLYVIISPAYITPFPDTKSQIVTKDILARYNVPLWDYSFDTTFRKRRYFYDNVHLNAKGALVFSEHIAKRIKDYMQKEKYYGVAE
jgi:hypothetical protein